MLCARAKYSVTRAPARSSTPSRSNVAACSADTRANATAASTVAKAAHVARATAGHRLFTVRAKLTGNGRRVTDLVVARLVFERAAQLDGDAAASAFFAAGVSRIVMSCTSLNGLP